MIFEQSMGWRWPDACEDTLEMLAHEVPDGAWIELLRSLVDPGLKQGRHTHQGGPRLLEMGVQTGQRNGRLPGMFGSAPHRI